jgi:hypothetical protein
MTLFFFVNIYIYIYILLSNLPVAIVTVKRSFSAMKIVNNRLRSRMSDQWMDNNLMKDISCSINNKVIM